MGCGCIQYIKNKDTMASNLNQLSINNFTLTEKDSKKNSKIITNNEIEKVKNNFNKINSNQLYSSKSLYTNNENNYYLSKEDFSEYYLLLGNDIETLAIRKEIFISCKNLSYFNRSFGYYVIIEKKDVNFWSFFSQTEISRYTSNPSFIKSFIINYNYNNNNKNKEQIFKFTVICIEKDEKIFQLGSIEINLQNLFSSKNQELSLNLKDKGEIIIRAEDKKNISEFVQMRIGIKGERMTNNKIFCRISRKINNKNELFPIYITEEKEHIYDKNEKIFYWELFEFDSDRISKNQFINQIKINIIKFQIYEVEKKRKQKLLTEKEVNIDDLINGAEFNLSKVTDEYNYLILSQIKKINRYSLYSFLISGLHYRPYFFIDCTRSKFNLILSEKLGNKYSKTFISNFQKDANNNEDFIYRSCYDFNIQTQKYNNLEEQILPNINGNNNYGKNLSLNNDDYYDLEDNKDNKENREDNKIFKNPFENKEKLSEEYMKYSYDLFNSLIKDQFLLNINNHSPLFLLGARIPNDNKIEGFNFAYNNDILNPELYDYKKMYEIYKNLLSKLFLSFPCIIQDSLNHFYKYVSNSTFTEEKQTYHVGFFILTNYMSDVNYLFEFLLKYNNFPFSIIIVS